MLSEPSHFGGLLQAEEQRWGLTVRISSPAVIADQGDKAAERFFTFLSDQIPNANTRAAYHRNVLRFFSWAGRKRLALDDIKSYHVSQYLAEHTLTGTKDPASTPPSSSTSHRCGRSVRCGARR